MVHGGSDVCSEDQPMVMHGGSDVCSKDQPMVMLQAKATRRLEPEECL